MASLLAIAHLVDIAVGLLAGIVVGPLADIEAGHLAGIGNSASPFLLASNNLAEVHHLAVAEIPGCTKAASAAASCLVVRVMAEYRHCDTEA